MRFLLAVKGILLSSIVNLLLVFVPVGIAVHFAQMPAGVRFAVNAIAIVPLAGLLSHATEGVASRLGDTVGALMNVTFGNAVELIIFIIALVKNHIRIVQASLVGSILVNLLLILGMCFLLGGLRFREQIYNSTVTQMSACLLALSVTSLLLPTAFHASFSNEATADDRVLKVSRGTSVIVLVVYFLYLVFQLKSHSYIYASTPQHIVERETVPGPAAQYFNPSSSESSSSGSDSEGSSRSSNTARRLRRLVRKGKMVSRSETSDRGTSAGSDTAVATPVSSSSAGAGSVDNPDAIAPANSDAGESASAQPYKRGKNRKKTRHHQERRMRGKGRGDAHEPSRSLPDQQGDGTRRVEFATLSTLEAQRDPSRKRALPFLPLRNPQPRLSVSSRRPAPDLEPRVAAAPATNQPHSTSRTTAVLLLLVSTALVAVCAEFMVSSIGELVATDPGLSEAFIGLVLLPLVGNAAEHVTAVSVALKNKMDLAIGVAVGSSIQIALFVTPLVVILGWGLGKDMGLFFTLFETVCVFVSAFIVNFLVLDGRSNYLEGALLCAGYVIIAVAAFFYPDVEAANELGGGD
ncbi:Sodium/calcium exchanger protein-domain-containing protein [Parachaetomium inaequale]|uniref:Sodium/calcium exchanger protein-domain-containing protein n=1 Tax=Parachaetomium inaequale TaxID=2588326 RepID=A0AAN6PP13_9PEZI|nr:Sodium/calcium exchanger protein-domain-containing protein [Parachaetomium inaequale]